MASQIREKLHIEPELIAGGKGIFDVALDGKLVFSKYKTDRFPKGDEVTEALSALTG